MAEKVHTCYLNIEETHQAGVRSEALAQKTKNSSYIPETEHVLKHAQGSPGFCPPT